MATDIHSLPRASGLVGALYRLGLVSKASVGLLQFCAGLFLWLAPAGSLVRMLDGISHARLIQNPLLPLLPALRTWAAALPGPANSFYALYLMGHGALSFCVILAIILRLRSAYPVAMVILSALVLYQIGEFIHTEDPALLALSAVDLIVMIIVSIDRLFSPPSSP